MIMNMMVSVAQCKYTRPVQMKRKPVFTFLRIDVSLFDFCPRNTCVLHLIVTNNVGVRTANKAKS